MGQVTAVTDTAMDVPAYACGAVRSAQMLVLQAGISWLGPCMQSAIETVVQQHK